MRKQPRQRMMTTRLSFEAPKSSACGRNRHALPLLQFPGHLSEDFPESASTEAAGLANTMQLPPAIKGRPQPTPGVPNCIWVHREQLISLYWEQNLPLREVQEIMKEEHGLNISVKVYKSHFRRWGVRKNLKGSEALKIAAKMDSSPIFWPEDRVDEYEARIHRHVKTYRRNKAITPSRRLRAPESLEKVEAATFYLTAYFTGAHNRYLGTWFVTGPPSGEQEAFSSLFIGGLARLSRNDQHNQAFKEINLAFEHLKQLVLMDHPLVYLRLVASIAAFNQYPKSEICSAVCRTLSDYLKKLSFIVHGGNHPLNHVWGESLHISAAQGPEAFALAVAAKTVRRCWPNEPRIKMGSVDIGKYELSNARGLDEASLRDRLAVTASRPDLISQAQETRLALCELLVAQVRMPEALHFFAEARAFQAADPIRRASKTFWVAELEWRSGNGQASINTLNSVLASEELATAGETNNEVTVRMRQEIREVVRRRQNLLALGSIENIEAD